MHTPRARELGGRSRSADERAAGVAHELANLTQALNGNLELLAARTTDATALRYLANARAAAEQLTELTAGLQDSAQD